MKALLILPFLALSPIALAQGGDRNITVVTAESSADGSSSISREKILDCIISLPDIGTLEALISSEPVFARELGGEPGRNEWIRSYIAQLDVTYLTREKDLIIVTTRSIHGQPPVFHEAEKTLRHTQSFVSNPSAGNTFAGRSNRQYYFTTPEAAIEDVRSRARVWVLQQTPAICPE